MPQPPTHQKSKKSSPLPTIVILLFYMGDVIIFKEEAVVAFVIKFRINVKFKNVGKDIV